jgi:LuxR family maltose regulon positive regulatory protein
VAESALPAKTIAPERLVVASKLLAPSFRPGHVRRPELVSRLRTLSRRRLTLLAAPAGFGKTTLLAEWLAEEPGVTVAWVSVDDADNDPRRLWSHVVAAFRRVLPSVRVKKRASDSGDPQQLIPVLLNVLGSADVALVLDDYHFITASQCHESVALFLQHLPENVHLVLSSRREPPLPLGRLRATGELGEIRANDLRFDSDESRALLVDSLGLPLTAADVARLQDKTEGWPAALYLAALSLQEADDAHAFVERFAGANRHIADYVTSEVLDAADADTRDFLLRTSVLEELSAGLCDAVLETERSGERLRELERSNLFVSPLDDTRARYRYHPLLGGLLRFELDARAPELVRGLHERASAWFEAHGRVDEAVRHGVASGNTAFAGELIVRHWCEVAGRRGRVRAALGWLEALPPAAVEDAPALALVQALLESQQGSGREAVDRLLARLADTDGAPSASPLPLGTASPRLEAAIVLATLPSTNVGHALADARVTAELARDAGPRAHAVALTAVAYWSLLAGRDHEALPNAKQALHAPASASMPLLWALQHAIASLAAAALGEELVADVFAERAVIVVEQTGHTETPRAALVWIAHGARLARTGMPDAAETSLAHAASLARPPDQALERALALLTLAGLRDEAGAAAVVEEARSALEGAADPGVLARLLAAARGGPGSQQRGDHDEISAAELRVLRLLPTRLTQREIGRELYVSFNTVKTHTRSLYRKLGADGRREAVVRARERRLI